MLHSCRTDQIKTNVAEPYFEWSRSRDLTPTQYQERFWTNNYNFFRVSGAGAEHRLKVMLIFRLLIVLKSTEMMTTHRAYRYL